MLILIAATGPEKGRIFELADDASVIVGRDCPTGLQISDRKASREHARLWCDGGLWYIKDLGSRHGTECNRQTITGPTLLEDGDYVRMGATILVVTRVAAEQAERIALLKAPIQDALNESDAGADTIDVEAGDAALPFTRRRWMPTVVGTGVAAAAAVAIAANVGMYVMSQRQAHDLRMELARITAQPAPTVMIDGDTLDATLLQDIADGQRSQAEQLKALASAVESQPDTQQLADAVAKRFPQPTPMRDAEAHKLMRNVIALLKSTESHLASADRHELSEQQVAGIVEHTLAGVKRDQKKLINALRREIQNDSTQKQMLDAIAGIEQAANDNAATERLTKKLDAALAMLEAQPSAAELADVVQEQLAAQPAATQAALSAADKKTLESVLGHLQTFAETDLRPRQLSNQQFAALLEAVRVESAKKEVARLRREFSAYAKHDAGRVTPGDPASGKALASTLAKVETALRNQPFQDKLLVDRLTEAVESRDEETIGLALKNATDALRDAQDTQLAELSEAMQTEVKLALKEHRLREQAVALADARIPRGSTLSQIDAQLRGMQPEVSSDALTEVQRAYQLAFETGRPVTVGGGTINPSTGRVNEGRLLDPSAARAAGIKDWREWYERDDLAEQMRLTQQSLRYKANTAETRNLIRLPSPTATEDAPIFHASPAPDVRQK